MKRQRKAAMSATEDLALALAVDAPGPLQLAISGLLAPGSLAPWLILGSWLLAPGSWLLAPGLLVSRRFECPCPEDGCAAFNNNRLDYNSFGCLSGQSVFGRHSGFVVVVFVHQRSYKDVSGSIRVIVWPS